MLSKEAQSPSLPVLICGAGPVGLSLSLALSRLGINNLLIEKTPGYFHSS